MVLGALAAASLLGEVVVRVFDLPPHRLDSLEHQNFVLSDDPILRYEYRPNFAGFDARAFMFPINADGFRDRVYSKTKPPATWRLLLLGDSVAAGNGVSDASKIFAKQLEQLLNAGSPPRGVEVLNMAVGGYQTLQEAELLRVRGLAYHPDVVIVSFCINDFAWSADGGVSTRLQQQLQQQGAGHFARIQFAPNSWKSWVVRHSRFAFALHGASSMLRESRLHRLAAGEYEVAGKTPVEAGLQLLRRLQEENGFRCILFIVPGLDRPFSRYAHAAIHERVRALARIEMPALEVVDLRDDLARASDDPSPLTYDGLHLTESGHRRVAEAMAPHLRALER